ncbi:unnamed protein product [Penicillium olsonii]|nr:unnamed protein product [Penicillium olsonii]CAG7929288.1 unnamed protein product [Penicillium olsonii]
MSHIETVELRSYYPPGVSEIIALGGGSFIGLIDDTTVLKYSNIPGDIEGIHVEAKLLEVLGSHPRIIASKGLTEHGPLLQRASNGSLYNYVLSQPVIALELRLRWCRQAAEAVDYIHRKHVIHYFQGMLKSSDNVTLLDGLSRECSKSYSPRDHGDFACEKTDIFALGSAIFFIMTGHEVFPDLDSLADEEEIYHRFQNGLFPSESHACSTITSKCWTQQYLSADEIIHDLSLVENFKEPVE